MPFRGRLGVSAGKGHHDGTEGQTLQSSAPPVAPPAARFRADAATAVFSSPLAALAKAQANCARLHLGRLRHRLSTSKSQTQAARVDEMANDRLSR
jgi:hypothetical protein